VEVPQIVKQGRLVAEREGAQALRFADALGKAPSCDILLSAGALQYLEHSVPGLLELMPRKPRYILLNKLPISMADEVWTLQNYGPAISPMRLFNRESFIAYFTSAGYRLADSWTVENLDCMIPFHPERYIKTYTGFAFELVDQAVSQTKLAA
jgi:putative methyltransferase (TIGR04325 family)